MLRGWDNDMARPPKTGIDYYPFDVNFLRDIKIRKILMACGHGSISILISLLSSIYRDEGYYVKWDEDLPFLVADELGTNEGAVKEVVKKAIQVGLFNEDIYDNFSVLTSKGIQERYMKACERRKEVILKQEYLLLDVNNILVNVCINSINDSRSTQRIVKDRIVKDSKDDDVQKLSDKYLSIVLSKKDNESSSLQTFISLSSKYTSDELEKVLDEISKSEYLKKNIESSFLLNDTHFKRVMSGGYRDFEGVNKKPKKSAFHNFEGASEKYTAAELDNVARKIRAERTNR